MRFIDVVPLIASLLLFCECKKTAVEAFAAGTFKASYVGTRTTLFLEKEEDTNIHYSRRQLCEKAGTILFGGAAVVFAKPTNANAAGGSKSSSLEADKQKLLLGYQRLNYLLDNWDKETTDCKTKTQYTSATKTACERTPLNVQNYLGYRSTEDPLFRADKTMRRLEALVPTELEVEYLDAMEKYNEKAEEGSGNSYTSSWGEANPGGGKDRVELFVERARDNVVDARDALGQVIKILGLLD